MNRDMSKMELLEQITALDFMIVDLNLYLDTHPMDREALDKYNSLVKDVKMLKETYERLCGMLSVQEASSSYPWEWISCPWPWEYEANFKL